MEYALTSTLTTRWFLSLRRVIAESKISPTATIATNRANTNEVSEAIVTSAQITGMIAGFSLGDMEDGDEEASIGFTEGLAGGDPSHSQGIQNEHNNSSQLADDDGGWQVLGERDSYPLENLGSTLPTRQS
jgi:hypothetical protein